MPEIYNNRREKQRFDLAITCTVGIAMICEILNVIFGYMLVIYTDSSSLELEFASLESLGIIRIVLSLTPLVLLFIYVIKNGSANLFAASVIAAGVCIVVEFVYSYSYYKANDIRLIIGKSTVYSLIIALAVAFAGICLIRKSTIKALVVCPLVVAIIYNAIEFIMQCNTYIEYYEDYIMNYALNSMINELLTFIIQIFMYSCMLLIALKIMPSQKAQSSTQSTHAVQSTYAVSPEEQFMALNEKLRHGTITQEEYAIKRKEIIDKL